MLMAKNIGNELSNYISRLHLVFLTGASGTGKTTLLNAFKKNCPPIPCFHFDSKGVPSEEEMVKRYGSGSEWQKAMTYWWIEYLITNYSDKKLIILEGQVNLDFIIDACERLNFHACQIVLAHCDKAIRHTRLYHNRNQPELINNTMDNWAEYLKKQALDKKVSILDTSSQNINDILENFKFLINL